MDKLEQVSDNPELKQEMEAEVASTNSNQVLIFEPLITSSSFKDSRTRNTCRTFFYVV